MLLGTFSHSKEFNEKRQQRNWKENSTILAIKNREKLSGTHTHTHTLKQMDRMVINGQDHLTYNKPKAS